MKRRDRHTVRGRDLVTVPESAREPNRRSEKRMRGVGAWTEPLGEHWRTGGELAVEGAGSHPRRLILWSLVCFFLGGALAALL